MRIRDEPKRDEGAPWNSVDVSLSSPSLSSSLSISRPAHGTGPRRGDGKPDKRESVVRTECAPAAGVERGGCEVLSCADCSCCAEDAPDVPAIFFWYIAST